MTHRTLRPNLPTVPVDDALYRRQSNARPGKLVVQVQPLEGAEELVRVLHIESSPVVLHKINIRFPGRVDDSGQPLKVCSIDIEQVIGVIHNG